MSRSDVLPFPKAPAAACQALDTAMAQAAVDPAAAWTLALPLLGQPALHIQALVLLINLCRRQGDTRTAALLAGRAARLAPGVGRARTLAAMALCEDGRPEAALGHALAAFTLAPDDPSAQTAVLMAARAVGRPLAGLDAAVALCRCPSPTEATPLAVGLLDACANGEGWGAVWPDGVGLAGCVRRTGPTPPEVILLADGVELGRAVADRPCPGSVPISGFSLALPPGLPAHTRAEVVLAQTDTALFGSPVVLADAQPAPRPSDRAQACAEACPAPARGVAAQPVATPQALAQLNGWLRQAALSPQAPPPLPEACLGAAVAEARTLLAARGAALEIELAAAARMDAQDDAHA